MKHLLIIALTLSLFGCANEKNFVKFQANPKHEEQAAQHCATWYPVKTFTKTITKTVAGKPDTVTLQGETVYVDCNEAVKNALDEASKSHIAVKCPPTKVITKTETVYVHDTTVEENTAALRALQLQSSALQANLATKTEEAGKYKKERGTWMARCCITWALLALILVAAIWGKVNKWI